MSAEEPRGVPAAEALLVQVQQASQASQASDARRLAQEAFPVYFAAVKADFAAHVDGFVAFVGALVTAIAPKLNQAGDFYALPADVVAALPRVGQQQSALLSAVDNYAQALYEGRDAEYSTEEDDDDEDSDDDDDDEDDGEEAKAAKGKAKDKSKLTEAQAAALMTKEDETIVGYTKDVLALVRANQTGGEDALLARAFIHLAIRQRDVDVDAANKAELHAASILRKLVKVQPELHRRQFVCLLLEVSNNYGIQEKDDAALDIAREAVEQARNLAGTEHEDLLARSLHCLGLALEDENNKKRQKQALAAHTEALAIFRKVATADPRMLISVIECMDDIANLQHDLEDFQGAYKMLKEAVALIGKLPKPREEDGDEDDEGNSELFVASVYDSMSGVCLELDKDAEALTYAVKAVDLWRKAAEEDRPEDDVMMNLINSLGNLRDANLGLKKYDEAVTAGKEVVKLLKTLSADNPSAYREDLRDEQDNLNEILKAQTKARVKNATASALATAQALAAGGSPSPSPSPSPSQGNNKKKSQKK